MSRADQRAQTRQRILDAARARFEQDGFEGASVREIAQEAGVAAGTVIMHFDGKAELLHAALFEELERALDEALAPRAEGSPFVDALDAVGERMFAAYTARPTLSRVLLKESLFAPAPWAERFVGQHQRVHAWIQAQGADTLPQDALALFGVAWLSFFTYALLAWAQGAHPSPVGLLSRLSRQHLAAAQTGAQTAPTTGPSAPWRQGELG
ncbi:MAG: TetR/AcrR family transcriptional regulator [Deltaproteobacteria bacterium]|nr:TetR/AcrR family transcriptional regulator [Deltaproteobacteria bacterium]